MYIPKQFQMNEPEAIYQVIEENGFATLFSRHEGMPAATHLPLLLNEEKTCLHGHFARANPQWKDIGGQQVLAVFHGPHCYISPSWYETGQAVPTWNYVSVHVTGEIELVDDEEELSDSLAKLVHNYEPSDSPYAYDAVDPAYLSGMSKGVQGFKLIIRKIEAKAKLSQNHPPERQQRVIRELEKSLRTDEQEIAKRMKANAESRHETKSSS